MMLREIKRQPSSSNDAKPLQNDQARHQSSASDLKIKAIKEITGALFLKRDFNISLNVLPPSLKEKWPKQGDGKAKNISRLSKEDQNLVLGVLFEDSELEKKLSKLSMDVRDFVTNAARWGGSQPPPSNLPDFLSSCPLTGEQEQVLQAFSSGKNVLVKGKPGTGKTFLINQLKARATPHTAFCALTAKAASNFSGLTLHSWARIKLGRGSVDDLIDCIQTSGGFPSWRQVQTLLVDEVSMMHPDLFQTLEEVARRIRQNEQPFGGIQLVLFGDFCQLPPISEDRDVRFCFEAKSWGECFAEANSAMIKLTRVFRQEDAEFLSLLDDFRRGQCSPATAALIQARSRTIEEVDSIIPTPPVLFAKNASADARNDAKLRQIVGEERKFTAVDWHDAEFGHVMVEFDRTVPAVISLKVGAKVVVVKNLKPLRLWNGACGVVTKFANGSVFVLFRGNGHQQARTVLIKPEEFAVEVEGKAVASRKQLPLQLAFALTIHKAQGMELSSAAIDLNDCFCCGQAYSAVSRVKTLEGLHILRFDANSVFASLKALIFDEN